MERTAAQRAYLAVNIIFAGVILLIMGYSFFYSPDVDKYPVPCIHETLTGQPCPSCGLSHAFSLIVRGRFDEAAKWNGASGGVFLFFVFQLVMRVAMSLRACKTDRHLRQIAASDAVLSSLTALAAFFPFLKALWLLLIR